jgi:catechol 2,3-dioxygenase-like lactoylglutathione lyase family enzyme
MFRISEPFHVGVIVADLEAAMADYSRTTGCTWHSIQQRDVTLRVGDDLVHTHVRFDYSVEGPVQLELIQGLPGTPWDVAVHGGLDHSGHWSDDLVGDTAAVLALGWEFLYSGTGDDGETAGFCFFMTPSGQRVELLDTSMRPMFERWFAGGDFDEAD